MRLIGTLIILTVLITSVAGAQTEQVWIKGNPIPPDTTAATPYTWAIVGDTLSVNGYVAAIAPPTPPTRRPDTPTGNLSQEAYDAMFVAKATDKTNYAIARAGCEVFGASDLVAKAEIIDEITILVTWADQPDRPEYVRIPTQEKAGKRSGPARLQDIKTAYEYDLARGKYLLIYSSSSFASVGSADWPAWKAEIERARAGFDKRTWNGHLIDPMSAMLFRNPATLSKVRRVAG
jgi:hypothetical protein